MFADDTAILVRGPSIASVSNQLNEVARTISTWVDNNRMSLNTTKTKSLLIITLPKRRTLTSSALNIQIDGRSIEQVDYAKLLGVMTESDMSWEHHIETICCIISSRFSLFPRIKPYLNFDSALRFYNSLAPKDLTKNFSFLMKCTNKFDCLVYEMFFYSRTETYYQCTI